LGKIDFGKEGEGGMSGESEEKRECIGNRIKERGKDLKA